MDLKHIEFIARGLLVGPRGVLVCRPKNGDYCYLPGGHIEFGEPAEVSLAREIDEELGMRVKVGDFLGAIECSFVQKNKLHHELNLVFAMSSSAIARRATLNARESHIEFAWQPAGALAEANLLPVTMRALIPAWSQGKRATWVSTMELSSTS